MIRTIIIDDQSAALHHLEQDLQESGLQVQVIAYCIDPKDGINLIQNHEPDLVFMSIVTSAYSSIQLLRTLEQFSFPVIFVASHEESLVRALTYSGVNYLLDPIDKGALISAVKKARMTIGGPYGTQQYNTLIYNSQPDIQPHELRLWVDNEYGFQVIPVKEILYCNSAENRTLFHLRDGQKIVAKQDLSEFEMLLEDNDFIQVNQPALISLHHIKEYRHGDRGIIVMSNGDKIEIDSDKQEYLLERVRAVCNFDGDAI